jgi:hypothetical protein
MELQRCEIVQWQEFIKMISQDWDEMTPKGLIKELLNLEMQMH